MGDFYETYSDDAITAVRILGLVQTKKSNGDKGPVAMAGFPHHALEGYLTKLVRAGYKVAVCDQLEDPKFANPANGDFHISGPTQVARKTGDPRWLP